MEARKWSELKSQETEEPFLSLSYLRWVVSWTVVMEDALCPPLALVYVGDGGEVA